MVWRVIGFVIFASFYAFYLAKLVILKRQEIKTNQMGVGNKERRVLAIERVMSVATVLTVVLGLGSILAAPLAELLWMRIAGILAEVMAAVMLHLQILQEENHLLKMVGAEYEEYRKRTMRYWGRIV